jgi:hypothetical protein
MEDLSFLQRCEDLWLDGGNLVIRAENTVFKVLAAQLSIASSVFRDMFSVPQPADGTAENFEGLPFVRLPDTAFDVTQFLKALVYPGCARAFLRDRQVLTDLALCLSYAEDAMTSRLAVVASILRLGSKYGVAHFRRIAIARLFRAIPTTLDHYYEPDDSENFSFEGYKREHTMLVFLHLAREYNLPALLPCCLWYWTPECVSLIPEYLPSKDGSSVMTEDGRVYALDLETYGLCIAAGWQLDERRRRLIKGILRQCSLEHPSCFGDASQLLDDLLTDLDINLLEKIVSAWWINTFNLCDMCAGSAEAQWEIGRKVSWDTLPSYYALPPWKELLAASQPTLES